MKSAIPRHVSPKNKAGKKSVPAMDKPVGFASSFHHIKGGWFGGHALKDTDFIDNKKTSR